MNPNLNPELGTPAITQAPEHELAPVMTASAVAHDPAEPLALDPSLGDSAPPMGAVAPKPLANPAQVVVIEDNLEAVRAMMETGYVRGKAIVDFLESGIASGISEAQAKRIVEALDKVQAGPTAEVPEDAPVLNGETVSPAAANDFDHEADADLQKEEHAWNTQPATDGMVREMNRVLSLRGEGVANVIANWQAMGVDIAAPVSPVTVATKGDFKALKAAEQAANIQTNAAKRLLDWEGVRANKDGVPYDPVQTVGEYATGKVTKALESLTKAPQAVSEAILGDRSVIALATAALAKNRSILDAYEAKKADGGYRPSIYDYAPNLERAIQVAIAQNPGLDAEGVIHSIKTAYSAGTNSMLYKLADAMGLKGVRKIEVKEPKAREPKAEAAHDPEWASKKITENQANYYGLSPETTRGEMALLRKEGKLQSAGTSTGKTPRAPYDPTAPAAETTVAKVQASAGSLDGLAPELAAKVADLRAGQAASLNRGEVADLRKAGVIE